jgi:electron transfer flavoprotein beta subunit
MKILVCVKQVPDTEALIKIDDSEKSIVQGPSMSFKMNRFDEFAMEEALQIREARPGTTIDAISVGPEGVSTVIKRALGMGADHGIHILTGDQNSLSVFSTASLIAAHAETTSYDLILAGVVAEDNMQGQVGPMVAELMGMPFATSVMFEQISDDSRTIYVEREIEGGFRDTLELQLPAILTVQSGINKPRYPSLSNIMRAKKQELETKEAESLGNYPARQVVFGLRYPEKSRAGVLLDGTLQEKAAQLLKILKEKALVQ